MTSFVDDFIDFFADTVTVTPGIIDGFGKFIASGAVVGYPCRIEGANIMVRDSAGKEVKSSVQIILAAHDLTTNLHRYTLPARYIPTSLRVAYHVERESDEDGPDHEVVFLP